VIRVALDTSAAALRPTGIGRYIVELVAALRQEADVEPVIDPRYNLWGGLSARHGSSLRGVVGGFIGEHLQLRPRLRRGAIAVYHATGSRAPARDTCLPLVVTVHDLAAFAHPLLQGRRRGAQLRAQIRHAVAHAHWIVLPTESVRQELLRYFPAAATKATAIHHGVGRPFGQAPHTPPAAPRFVTVATLERRKNLASLLDAFALVVARHPAARLRLLGQPQNASATIRARLTHHRLGNAVTVEGYVSEDDLARAYACSTAMVYPSLYEGFGLPILEAMASGVPVITSDRGAMREVAGEAALLVDPGDVQALAAAMLSLVDNRSLQSNLSAAGREHAARYTWGQCARRHAAVYRVAADAGGASAPPAASSP
jgi:glycosyltransferase involved in cell wall biosynthesis